MLIGDANREIRVFQIAGSSTMGTKRGVGRGGFIDSVLGAVDGFYGAVVQQLRPWSPKAPRLPSGPAAEEAGLQLEPPLLDLLEAGSALDQSAGSDASLGTEYAAVGSPDENSGDVVSWSAAMAKVDQERESDVYTDVEGDTPDERMMGELKTGPAALFVQGGSEQEVASSLPQDRQD